MHYYQTAYMEIFSCSSSIVSVDTIPLPKKKLRYFRLFKFFLKCTQNCCLIVILNFFHFNVLRSAVCAATDPFLSCVCIVSQCLVLALLRWVTIARVGQKEGVDNSSSPPYR